MHQVRRILQLTNEEIPKFLIDGLKPIIDARQKINEIIWELIPKYYTAEIKEDSTDE